MGERERLFWSVVLNDFDIQGGGRGEFCYMD